MIQVLYFYIRSVHCSIFSYETVVQNLANMRTLELYLLRRPTKLYS